MTIKTLLSSTINVRNLISLLKRNVSCAFQQYSNNSVSEEIKPRIQLSNNNYFEYFHQSTSTNFITKKTISHILNVLEDINPSTRASIFNELNFSIRIENKSAIRKAFMHEKEVFAYLCALICSQLPELNISQLARLLVTLVNRLKIPSSSELIVSVLNRIESLLNTGNFKDYYKLKKLISAMPSTELILSISNNLDRNISSKISADIDLKMNIIDLIYAYLYAVNYLDDKKISMQLVEILKGKNLLINIKTLGCKTLAELHNALNKNSLTEVVQDMLYLSEKILMQHLDNLSSRDIVNLVVEVSKNLNNPNLDRTESFYSHLLDTCAQQLISKRATLNQGINCLKSFIRMQHVHKDLLNYVSAKFYAEKKYMRKGIENEDLLTLMHGMAASRHKPVLWEKIYKDSKKLRIFSEEKILTYALLLACMNTYDEVVLKRLFDSKTCPSKDELNQFRILYQWLSVLPNYDGPLPSRELINSLKISYSEENKDYPLLNSLVSGVGGSLYIKSNLQTKLFHYIDYVAVFRTGGYPVLINRNIIVTEYIEYLEDIQIPSNCQMVVINCIPEHYYSRNTHQLLGPYSLSMETLETVCKNYNAHLLLISLSEWNKLLPNQRVSFLMKKVHAKLNIQ